MTAGSDNNFPKLLLDMQTSNPALPSNEDWKLYAKPDGIYAASSNARVGPLAAATGGGISSGTSFPGSPSNGDLFYRTDLDLLCRYRSSGTRWVTTTLYRESFGLGETAMPDTSSTTSIGKLTPWSTEYDLYLEAFYTSTFVLTTNDGSKYWTLALAKSDAAAADTTIVSFNTSAHTASNWTQVKTSIGAAYVAASYRLMHVIATKTSTPGNLYWAASLSYRLIIT